MHPYRPRWQYGYALAPGAGAGFGTGDASNAYTSYYQMYAGVPAVPPPPPPSDTTPAYSSDFSSGTSGFRMPPPVNQYHNLQNQNYQKRLKHPASFQTNQNLQQVPLTKQPPLPPPQETPKAGQNINLAGSVSFSHGFIKDLIPVNRFLNVFFSHIY